MSVIKDAYKSREITRCDVLPLSFLKKSAYNGSKRMLCYRLEKTEIEVSEDSASEAAGNAKAAGKTDAGTAAAAETSAPKAAETVTKAVLRCKTWRGPYILSETPEEEIKTCDLPFSDEGIDEAIVYLNQRLSELEEGAEARR